MMAALESPWRSAFAALEARPHGKRLAFFDSAASAQKPQAVVAALAGALEGAYANVHRGLYDNSARTTAAFEEARGKIAAFLGHVPEGTVLVKSATEGLNLLAQTWGRAHLRKSDVVVLSALEHHANIVPWQLLQRELGFEIKVIPLAGGGLDMAAAEGIFAAGRVKLLAISQMSNVLGVRPDVAALAGMARAAGAVTFVDGSQGAVHGRVDFAALNLAGVDAYVMTGHKLYGPNGVGVVLGMPDFLDALPPWQGGGDMIESVSFEGTTFAKAPARFEAGTPAIAEVIALGAACDFVREIGWRAIDEHERALVSVLDAALDGVGGLARYSPKGSGIVAFNLEGAHFSDVATLLDAQGVAVRTGHHCAMPLMAALGVEGCVRASVGLYNDEADVAQLAEGLAKARGMLG